MAELRVIPGGQNDEPPAKEGDPAFPTGLVDFDYNGEWAYRVERELSAYLGRLSDSIDDDTISAETVSGHPYCACETCNIREILSLVIPRVLQGVAEDDVWQVD